MDEDFALSDNKNIINSFSFEEILNAFNETDFFKPIINSNCLNGSNGLINYNYFGKLEKIDPDFLNYLYYLDYISKCKFNEFNELIEIYTNEYFLRSVRFNQYKNKYFLR